MSRPHTPAVPDILDRVGRVSIDIPSLNLSMWPPLSERGSKAVWPGAISITTWSISTTGRPPTARFLPPSILHRKSRWAGSAAFVTRSEIGRLPAAGRCCQWFAPREVRSWVCRIPASSVMRGRQPSALSRREACAVPSGLGQRRRRAARVGVGRITVSFRPAIPRRVAPQQNPLPLHRPRCTSTLHCGTTNAAVLISSHPRRSICKSLPLR